MIVQKKNNIIIIYLMVLILVLISSVIISLYVIPTFFRQYARIALLLIWVVLSIACFSIDNAHTRYKAKEEKVKVTLIIVISYYIVYFLLGIIFGFQKSPYSMNLISIIRNIIYVVGLVALQEFVRTKLLNAETKMKNYIVITVLFIILNIDFQSGFAILGSSEEMFKFIVSDVLVAIAMGYVSSYLAITGGIQLVYSYILPITLMKVLIPIFPNIDWFLQFVFDALLAITIFAFNNYEHTISTNRLTRRQTEKLRPRTIVTYITITILASMFVAGMFPYKAVGIMSYSMSPTFNRGSVVIVKKISKDKINNLKVGEVIEYSTTKGNVIHRVAEITEDEERNTIIITKGDNNKTVDKKAVEPEQVLGTVKFYIPYIGYPSVWFSELVLKKASVIEL